MPRHCFHVIDGRAIIDNEGSDLPSLKEAGISGLSLLRLRFSAEDQNIAPQEGQGNDVPA